MAAPRPPRPAPTTRTLKEVSRDAEGFELSRERAVRLVATYVQSAVVVPFDPVLDRRVIPRGGHLLLRLARARRDLEKLCPRAVSLLGMKQEGQTPMKNCLARPVVACWGISPGPFCVFWSQALAETPQCRNALLSLLERHVPWLID